MARICVITVPPEENAQQFTKYAQEIAAKVWRPETELGIKSPNPGIVTFTGGSRYTWMLNCMQIVEKAIEADREGYDAVVIHGFVDPGLREARSAISIPIIGPAESSMLLAGLYGSKFGVVTISAPGAATQMNAMVRDYGLEDRAIPNPVRPISISWPEYLRMNLEERAQKALPAIMERSKECIADGADVIIIGCTMLGPACTLAGISKVSGIEADVPLLDCLAVALKTAETMVDFQAKTGVPPVGRTGIYVKAGEKEFNWTRKRFGLKTY